MRIICYDSNNNPLKRFYQWDTNQTISISGIIMPPVPVFHFCNRLSQSALVVTATVEGNVIKAPVPNVLLEQAETIVVYMYEETPNDGSRTTHTITIPVIPRPKPNDYNYIDNIEYPSYAMLDARINEILASMGDEEGGLAELSDMRIGVDGTKYQTAGEAMRSQFSEVVQAREDKNGVKYVALKDRLNAYQDEVEALSEELHYNYQNLSHIVDELINVNLDDYKTAGTYRIRSASDAETIQNIPENVAGRLTVMATTESGRVLQTYVTNSSTPRMYVRFFNGTEWREWDKFASSSEVNSLLEDLENISNDLNQNYQNLNNTVEELTNGNLDDYKTAGNYKVLSADIAKNIQNIPEAIAGRLTVMVTTQTNRTLQIYVTNASTPKVYIRYFNGTKWNTWNSFANTTEFKNYESLNHVDAEEITSGNLDDCKIPGSYKIRSASNAATIQNIPEAIAGRLTVMATTESGRVLQTYVTNSSTPRMYVRFFNGTEWREWDKFASGKAVDSLSENCVNATNTTITANNYTNYFTDYNDIPVNTVYDIASGVPLLNSPPGNTMVDREDETTGYIGGVVVTFCGKSDKSRSVLQIFSSRSTAIEQTFLCFRMAYPVDEVLQWSPWQKMSNHNNLTASNVAIRKEISTRFFSDFNDAPINSIYQIDLDCDEGTLANHPNAGRSSVLVTLGFSPTSRHGMVQLCFGMLGSSEHGMWYRYGYKESADKYIWTKWNKVGGESNTEGGEGTVLANKGRLANGTDLNSIEENAIYLLSGGGNYLNTPPSSGNGFLTTRTVEGVTQQIYDKFSGESWSRYKTSSSEWSEWIEGFESQESVVDLQAAIQKNADDIAETNSRIDELENNSDSELAAQVNQNKTDILKVIDACCDTETSNGNYNLLKLSEVSYSSRLQNDAEEIVLSSATNAVTAWFPVQYGKYYVLSVLYNGSRAATLIDGNNWLTRRIQIKLMDGSIAYHNLTSGDYSLFSEDNGKKVVQIPYENAVEMRFHFSIGVNDISSTEKLEAFEPMIIEGSTIAETYDNSLNFAYISGDTEVPTETRYILKSDKRKADKISLSPYYRDVNFGVLPFTYYKGLDDNYSIEGFDYWNTKYADYIALWKSLVANHSGYVTEIALGAASDNQTIYLYDFKPARITDGKPIPKIILIAGQHGGEVANVFGLYYFVKNLLTKWNQHPTLEYLRNHVELMIVPVVNTYGFDNHSYKNANGANINRNYDSGWVLEEDTTSNQYGGAEPFDQPETQIIRDLLLNNIDAVLIVDSHVNGGGIVDEYKDINYYGICPSEDNYYNRMVDAVAHNLSSISANFNIDYNLNQPNTLMGHLNHYNGAGLLRMWAVDNNLVGTLLEGFGGFPNASSSHTPEVFKANEEIIANWLITAINYLGK